jgi:hypothetical protein
MVMGNAACHMAKRVSRSLFLVIGERRKFRLPV